MSEDLFDEMIGVLQDFNAGIYDQGLYRSQDDLIDAAKEKKTFVFRGKIYSSDYGCGLCFSIIMFTMIIVFSSMMGAESAAFINQILGLLGGLFILLTILNLIFKPKARFVLSLRGIFMKTFTGKQKCYSWKRIADLRNYTRVKVEGSRRTPIGKEIKFFIDTGKIIKIKPTFYNRDEFPLQNWNELFCDLFVIYWKIGKKLSE